jgi:hypothetical protein
MINIKYVLFKIITIKFIIIIIIKYFQDQLELNKIFLNYQKELNISFSVKIKRKIRIGIYTLCLENGGRARIASMLINHLYKFKLFNIILYTQKLEENNEYSYSKKIKRFIIDTNNVTKIFKNKIDILIFHLNSYKRTRLFNYYNNIKVIYYMHNSIFGFIHSNYTYFKILFKEYTKSKYLISLIPFENDFLFKELGINSILMNNFITYNYKRIIPSNLSSKIILMIGRANDKNKRFDLGIMSMEYIIQVIQDCILKIISQLDNINDLINLIDNLNLRNKIKVEGLESGSQLFFKNESLHFFPSISESFGLVLAETKMYGIPNILMGINYISLVKNGTIIIYDDTPESLAKEGIIILLNNRFREYLGKESKKSMKKYNNEALAKKWINLILYINYNDSYYFKFKRQNIKITDKESLFILNKQNHILKMRQINNFQNFTFLIK